MRRLRRALWLIIGPAALIILCYILTLFKIKPLRLIETGLLAMTPLALAAVGECINERAGVINIGLEGIFLLTAVISVYWAEIFGAGVFGVLMGGVIGAIIGLILGVISTYGKAEQIIAGMGLNIIALGLVQYLLMALWAFPGIHIFPRELMVPAIIIKLPAGIFRLSPITIFAIASAFIAHYILFRTLLGIRIRAAGEVPEAIDVAGINVNRLRLFTSGLCGFLAGIGGAFMPLAWFGGLVKEISAGRGFIALAAVVFSGLNPLLALAASFIFGFAEGLAFTVMITPGVKRAVPFHFIHMIPYILTIVILAAFLGGKRFPRALGKPYIRE